MYDGSRCFCASISLPMMLICPRFVVDCRFDSYAQVERFPPSGLVAEHIRSAGDSLPNPAEASALSAR